MQPKSPGYSKDSDNIETLIAKYQQGKKSSNVSREKSEQYSPCPSHPTNSLKYYCENDKTLLCVDCLKHHKEHNVDEIINSQDIIASDAARIKE